MWIVYFPIYIYWLFLSIKARSFFYFTATNPGLENGGMLGESKYKILETLPLKPVSGLFTATDEPRKIIQWMTDNFLTYPIIVKPDIGERGWGVKKIANEYQLEEYINKAGYSFIVQEYVDFPHEAGVFYYKYPGTPKGTISSIVLKEMLSVKGDGKSTLRELILKNNRAKLQIHELDGIYREEMTTILPAGAEKELIPIGNHCLGTKFLNGNDLIDDPLITVFETISSQLEGFYFGRYDIRYRSVEALKAGDFKIMELNGAGAEPAHIYHPGFSLWKGLGVLFHHWKVMYDIARINHEKGVPYMTFQEGLNEVRKVKQYNKQHGK